MVMQIQAGQTVRATPATIPKSFFAAAPISEAPGEREREKREHSAYPALHPSCLAPSATRLLFQLVFLWRQ